MKDYYDILDIKRDASAEEIRAAYRTAAHLFHEDHWGAASENVRLAANRRMMQVNEAYAVLSDPARRRVYDEDGRAAGARTSSSTDSRDGTATGTEEYSPIIEVDPTSLIYDVEEGQMIHLEFAVRHVTGRLPHDWVLGVVVTLNGEVRLDAIPVIQLRDGGFPARVRIDMPPELPGTHLGEIELSIERIGAA